MKYFLKNFKLVWNISKTWIITSIIIRICLGLIPLSLLWLTKELVNKVSLLITHHTVSISSILFLLIMQFTIATFQSLLEHINEYLDAKVAVKIDYEIGKKVSSKSLKVPLAYFDLPEFSHHHDRIRRGGFSQQVLSPIKNLLDTLKALINLISCLSFLFYVHWSLVLITIVLAIPLFIVQLKYGNDKFSLVKLQTSDVFKANYTQALMHNRQSAKEIRIFGLGNHLQDKWGYLFLKSKGKALELTKKEKRAYIILDMCSALLYGCSAGIVVWLIRVGKISIGEFVSMGQAILGAQSAVNLIASYLARMFEQQLYIEDLFKYLDFEIKDLKVDHAESKALFPQKLNEGIKFHDVSFKYPNSDKYILKNINFNIKPGEKIAIVGANGSGKTTLVNCLLGLYTIKEGNIYFDNISINDFNKDQLQRNMTVIFQDFMKYAFQIKDNIGFGDIKQMNNDLRIKDVGKKSGIDSFVSLFRDGYNTYVGKVIADGEELSGGQWQKVALGRALFKDSNILILDEPTAALDPQTELDVFNNFNQFAKHKTTIYISHRMAAAKMADRIFVMKNGELIEVGSHNELIKNNNEYYKMFQMQAKWYA